MKDKETPILVTIQCITYNQESYIRQCLEGFVMQKTTFRFEAIIHDDASTDGTAKIVMEYAEKYPNIIKPIIETENQFSKHDGSLERILYQHTHGKYVAICEGDDYWVDPFKLEKQVGFLESHPSFSMCVHAAVEFYQNGEADPLFFPLIRQSQKLSLSQIIDDWIIPTASILVRASIYPFPQWTQKIYSGDMTIALMAYSKGDIYYMKDIMSFYRKSQTGMSNPNINPPEYVCEQKALLFEYYNKETDFKYSDVLNRKKEYYQNNARLWKYRKKGLLYAFIKMPVFFISKLIHRY